jgi:hypothetical protein
MYIQCVSSFFSKQSSALDIVCGEENARWHFSNRRRFRLSCANTALSLSDGLPDMARDRMEKLFWGKTFSGFQKIGKHFLSLLHRHYLHGFFKKALFVLVSALWETSEGVNKTIMWLGTKTQLIKIRTERSISIFRFKLPTYIFKCTACYL